MHVSVRLIRGASRLSPYYFVRLSKPSLSFRRFGKNTGNVPSVPVCLTSGSAAEEEGVEEVVVLTMVARRMVSTRPAVG